MTPQEGYYLPSRQMVSQASQAMIAAPHVPRSTFVGQKMRKMTFDAGYLVPFLVEEVLPGDDLSYQVSAYVRMATPLFPLFSNFKIETFFFFTPSRIVWPNFVKMMGEQDSPGDSIAFTIPLLQCPAGGFVVGSIADHMGLPCVGQITAGQFVEVNTLPFRAYNRIYRDWFRDENSINSPVINTGDAADAIGSYALLRRAKSADYFTRALPWPQKFTAPTALGTQAPVVGLGVPSPAANVASGLLHVGVDAPSQIGGLFTPAFVSAVGLVATATAAGNVPLAVYADLSSISVNTLRLSFLVQELLERDARGGTRYVEIMKSHFGVTSPDMRLQRPEYIGGGSSPLTLTPIAATSAGAGLGSLGAAGSGFGQHGARYAATEHGYILGLINVQSELLYQQGLHKMWSRRTRYDFYWPSLAGLGEQAVLRQEIYCTGVDANDSLVFGYNPRWDEYRQMYSDATGLFRSTSAGNIDEWHTGQQFTAPPGLGPTFLDDTPPMARVLAAASTGMEFLADIMIQRSATRPLPVHGTPQTLGSF